MCLKIYIFFLGCKIIPQYSYLINPINCYSILFFFFLLLFLSVSKWDVLVFNMAGDLSAFPHNSVSFALCWWRACQVHTSSWLLSYPGRLFLLINIKCSSCPFNVFHLNSVLPDIIVTISVFLWLVFAWYIFFQPFILSHSVLLCLKTAYGKFYFF